MIQKLDPSVKKGKEYKFKAESIQERNKWFKALKNSIAAI